MPFTRSQTLSNNQSNRKVEDKRTADTIQHARLITNQHESLAKIDIKTAEDTARMVNAGKIFSGLLVYLTSPKPRIEDNIMSTDPPTTGTKGSQPTKTPRSAAAKGPKPLLSADELQGLGPVLKHKRLASNPDNDVDGVNVTENPTLGVNSAPDHMSVRDPEELAAAIRSTKRGKASKKKRQGGKQILNERTKSAAASTVSAYPTQRPPRKKPGRKSINTRESPGGESFGPEESDIEQVSATRPLPRFDQEENIPEQRLIPEESSQKDIASPESASEEYEESEAQPREVFGSERIATDLGFCPSDFVVDSLITTADTPIAFSLPTKLIQKYGSGAKGLLWAYASDTQDDETLDDTGIWLWRKPKTQFRTHTLLRTEMFGHSVLAPVVISHKRTGDDEPIIEFDGKTVHIVPHEQHWEDVRSNESHPDFLIPRKLADYQACEVAGYQVWRHTRDLSECRKPGCDAMVSDYHHSAIVCLRCGPKSLVRYCSLQHQLEDITGHWKECGTWRVIPNLVIDNTTAPSKFARMCPAIKQRHGSRTAALHRQILCCALTYGHYTLFDSASNCSETLCWPKQDPKWPEMDRRVERILNVAFLDSWNHYVLGYLYRLLRELLRSRGEWSRCTEQSLKLQFEAEFSNYKVNTNWHNGDAPCECEWSGKRLPLYDHLSTCWEYAPVADDCGSAWRQRCLEATVEDYERRFWILRAWRQQHPTQNNWRLRAAGYGFPDVIPDEECYELGPGWTGWEGEQDNVCEDQRDHGENRSMRSA